MVLFPAHPPHVRDVLIPETHDDGNSIGAERGKEQGNGATPLKKYSGSRLVAQILTVNKTHPQQSIQPPLVLP